MLVATVLLQYVQVKSCKPNCSSRLQKTKRELAISQLGTAVELNREFAESFVVGRRPNDTAALAKKAQKKAKKEARRRASRCTDYFPSAWFMSSVVYLIRSV